MTIFHVDPQACDLHNVDITSFLVQAFLHELFKRAFINSNAMMYFYLSNSIAKDCRREIEREAEKKYGTKRAKKTGTGVMEAGRMNNK